MKAWKDKVTGEIFEDEYEARNAYVADMTWDDYEDYFRENVDFHDFFMRAQNITDRNPFFTEFETETYEAEEAYFTANCDLEEIEIDEDE